MKLMVPEVSLIRKLAQKETWRAGSWILCACTCWGVGVCVQTPGSAASCYKSYFEVGFDNLISSAALFHLWGKKEHILQEKLQAQSFLWSGTELLEPCLYSNWSDLDRENSRFESN